MGTRAPCRGRTATTAKVHSACSEVRFQVAGTAWNRTADGASEGGRHARCDGGSGGGGGSSCEATRRRQEVPPQQPPGPAGQARSCGNAELSTAIAGSELPDGYRPVLGDCLSDVAESLGPRASRTRVNRPGVSQQSPAVLATATRTVATGAPTLSSTTSRHSTAPCVQRNGVRYGSKNRRLCGPKRRADDGPAGMGRKAPDVHGLGG